MDNSEINITDIFCLGFIFVFEVICLIISCINSEIYRYYSWLFIVMYLAFVLYHCVIQSILIYIDIFLVVLHCEHTIFTFSLLCNNDNK